MRRIQGVRTLLIVVEIKADGNFMKTRSVGYLKDAVMKLTENFKHILI